MVTSASQSTAKLVSLPVQDWGTTDPSYSPHHLYTGSTDGKGNSHEVRVRIPPTVAGQIASMIEQRAVPGYRTGADFVRDAIIHRLKFLVDEMVDNPKVLRGVKGELSLAALQRMSEEISRHEEQVQQLRDGLKRASDNGNEQYLREAVGYAWDVVEGMEEPWKSRAVEEIRKWEK
jgi:hypothetical protein